MLQTDLMNLIRRQIRAREAFQKISVRFRAILESPQACIVLGVRHHGLENGDCLPPCRIHIVGDYFFGLSAELFTSGG